MSDDPFAPPPFGHEEVLRGRSKRSVREAALVLQSAGIAHVVESGGPGARILVGVLDAERASDELVDYGRENAAWPPPRPEAVPARSKGLIAAAVFAVTISVMYPIGQSGGFGMDFWSAGGVVAGKITNGEVWRAWTALTLHVDLQHLVSNLVFGLLFGVLAAQALGNGVAWCGTVLAGAMGNWVEAYITDPGHRAVGASTAIFGTLGLMVSAEWLRRGADQAPWVRRVAPLFGGAVLFGWLGVGDGSGRVDVLAHATGFASGALLGVLVGWTRLPDRLSTRGQTALALVAIAMLAAAWAIGLSA